MKYDRIYADACWMALDGATLSHVVETLEARYRKGMSRSEWEIAVDLILVATKRHYVMNNDPEELRRPRDILQWYLEQEKKAPAETSTFSEVESHEEANSLPD